MTIIASAHTSGLSASAFASDLSIPSSFTDEDGQAARLLHGTSIRQ